MNDQNPRLRIGATEEMSPEEREAYYWALSQNYQSVAARNAQVLARFIQRVSSDDLPPDGREYVVIEEAMRLRQMYPEASLWFRFRGLNHRQEPRWVVAYNKPTENCVLAAAPLMPPPRFERVKA